MTTGEKIYVLRKAKGLSQEQLAEALSVSRQTLSKWELDTVLPDTENAIKLSAYFSVSIDYLLKEEESGAEKRGEEKTILPGRLSRKAMELIEQKGYLGAYLMALYYLAGLLPFAFILWAYLSVMTSLAPLSEWIKIPPSLLIPGTVLVGMLFVIIKACFYFFLGRKLKKLSQENNT